MLTRKINAITGLFLVILISLDLRAVELSDVNRITITDFKYYRKLEYKNEQLLIYKNNSFKNIFYTSSGLEQSIIRTNNFSKAIFKIGSKSANYKIVRADNLVKYFENKKTVHFNTDLSYNCEKLTFIDSIKSVSYSLLKKISNFNLESVMDNSCTAEQKSELNSYLISAFSSEHGWITDCFKEEAMQKWILSNPNFLVYAGNILSKYLFLAQEIQKNKNSFSISCNVNDEKKMGLYDETAQPKKIGINFDAIKKSSNGSQAKIAEDIKSTLTHELFHYGQDIVESRDEKYNKCVNESYTTAFTNICTEIGKSKQESDLKNVKFYTSEEIDEPCGKESKSNLDLVEGVVVSNNKDAQAARGGAPRAQSDQAKTAAATQVAIQNNLQKTVKASDFHQVSDSTFAKLASAVTPGVQEGKSYTVSANSDFGRTVQSTMESFKSSGNTLTAKLNTAIAATTPQAVASNRSPASSLDGDSSVTKQGTSTGLSNSGTTNPTSSLIGSASATPVSASTPNNSDNPVALRKMAASGNALSSTSNIASPSTAKVTLDNATGAGSNTARVAVEGTTNGAPTPSGGSRSPASIPSPTSANSNNSVVTAISSLKAYSKIAGADYKMIQAQIENSAFKNLLQTYDMQIRPVDKNGRPIIDKKTGKPLIIGTTGKPKWVFTDDGQKLLRVDEKK